MNSQSERISPEMLRQKQKQMIDRAAAVQPTVAVSEPNWKAMIDLQREQVNTLAEILQQLNTLATEEQMVAYMNQQMKLLMQHTEESIQTMEEYQQTLMTSAQQAAATIEKQAGKMNEEFGKAILQERLRMKKHTKILFWIAMIPSLIFLLLEWMPHIWQLIFPA